MAEGRSKIILAAVAGAESVWLFALFSLIGLIGDMGGSPLPWVTVLGLLVTAIATGYVFAGSRGEDATLAIWQAAFGVIVIYLLMGTGTYLENRTFDAAWIVRLVGGEFGGPQIASVIFAFAASLWLWRHGFKLATDRYPEDRLSRVFKLGIAVLAVAVLVDEASDEDFGAGALLVPFFGFSLVGMAVGRLPESGGGWSGKQWARTIAVSVFAVMGMGLLLGLVGGLYGSGGVRLLFAGWGLLVDGFLWVLRFPITWAVAAVTWFFNLFSPNTAGERAIESGPLSGQETLGIEPGQMADRGNETVDTIINILQYPVIVILVIVAFFVLALVYRRLGKRDKKDDGDERESIRGDADTAGDMARLLRGLVPGWMRGRDGKQWRYPEQPGIAEVFKLYFKTIAMGMKWGMKFDPNMTPAERLPLLELALPGAPVRQVTDRFNAACYGLEPTDRAVVAELEASLVAAEKNIRAR